MGSNQVSIDLTGSVVSESYIDTTFSIIKNFGAKAAFDKDTKFLFVKSFGYDLDDSHMTSSRRNIKNYVVESDISTAAFDVAYSAIFGQPITLNNVTSE